MRDRRDREIKPGVRVAYSARLGSTRHTLYTGVVTDTDRVMRWGEIVPSLRIKADHSGRTAERSPAEVLVLQD